MTTLGQLRSFRGRPGIPWLVAVAAVALLVAAGCGGDHSGGPSAAPEDVVTRAPDITLSAGTAQIRIDAPEAHALGTVDLGARSGHLTVSATPPSTPADLLISGGDGYFRQPDATGYVSFRGAVPAPLQGGDPFADLDLIRGTVHILSDGGEEANGASTIRYTLTIDPAQAVSTTPAPRQAALRALLSGRTADFQIDVWIDSKLQVRRVQVPVDLKSLTPATQVEWDKRLPVATDVSYLAFGVPVPPVVPPTTIPR
jgi:hypothetical protein